MCNCNVFIMMFSVCHVLRRFIDTFTNDGSAFLFALFIAFSYFYIYGAVFFTFCIFRPAIRFPQNKTKNSCAFVLVDVYVFFYLCCVVVVFLSRVISSLSTSRTAVQVKW